MEACSSVAPVAKGFGRGLGRTASATVSSGVKLSSRASRALKQGKLLTKFKKLEGDYKLVECKLSYDK